MTVLAIFDMDETLIDCDSSSLWLRYLVQRGVAAADMLVTEQAMMQAYHLGELSMAQYMDFTLQPLSGVAVSEVERWADDFVSSIVAPRIYPAGRRQYGYSDSVNDLPLLHVVQHACVVNPAPALKQVSDQHQWRQYDWQLAQDKHSVAGQTQGAACR
ncbi:MAG: haloacid dehalogenase-like hydrolase [Pseudomonas fluorescens]|nr:haloacid dehalogenase-like hydrolase [Pseudomonas fluorescens]